MSMFSLAGWLGGTATDDEMARANSKPIDEAKVNALVQQLKLASRDDVAFDGVYNIILGDKQLTVAELGAIAQGFAGGLRPKSKKAAITAIGQERLRIVHAESKAKSAAKARVW